MNDTIICVTGFGWSGSGAVFDLLREYDDLKIVDNKGDDFEFTLLTSTDGLYDLRHALMEKNCRINSSTAIDRFLSFIHLQSSVLEYEQIFKGQYELLATNYVEHLVDFSFKGWTFSDLTNPSPKNRLKNYYNSFIDHILRNRITIHFPILTKLRNRLVIKVEHDIRVSYYPDNFNQLTTEYLNRLFDIVRDGDASPLVFDQIFPPDSPQLFSNFFERTKTIIVRRDPRDTYLLAKCAYQYMAIPLPIENVDDFIVFYRKIIENTKIADTDSILSIQFEDMIYKYEETKLKIEEFLGISNHVREFDRFNPKISINNTQLYDKYPEYADDIKKIERELRDSLYDFPICHYQRTSNEVF